MERLRGRSNGLGTPILQVLSYALFCRLSLLFQSLPVSTSRHQVNLTFEGSALLVKAPQGAD